MLPHTAEPIATPTAAARPRKAARLAARLLAICVAGAALASLARAEALVVALGDSLVAGYGLAAEEGFAAVLERRLAEAGVAARVENAGVSGDTTAGGLARLGWAVGGGVDLVIVELGANDMLRGIEPAVTRDNLDAILTDLTARKIPVLLAGMKAQRNLGPDYAAEFDAIYPELAAKHGVALYPFFLEGVARRLEMNQGDGLHPNAQGVEHIVKTMLPVVTKLLRDR
jgi:acyl-CoA thioesterase-1